MQKMTLVTIILVFFGGALWFFKSYAPLPDEESRKNASILSGLNTEKLSSITVQGKEGKVELIKGTEEEWDVKGLNYQANQQKIQKLLVKLLKVKREDVVSTDQEHFPRFHLVHLKENGNKWEKDKTGTLLKLNKKEGTPLLELLLGKDRESGSGQYIRYAEQSEVFRIPESIQLDTNSEDWLNKTIVDVDGEKEAKTITLEHDGQTLNFRREKKEEDWKMGGLEEKEKLDQSQVKSLSRFLKALNFTKLLPVNTPAEQTGRQILTRFSEELFDGRIIQVNIGEKEVSEENYYYLAIKMALKDGVMGEVLKKEVKAFNQRSKPWLYALNSWEGKKLLKKHSDFITRSKEKQ